MTRAESAAEGQSNKRVAVSSSLQSVFYKELD